MKSSLHRARFYGILDTAYVSLDDWTAKCEALIGGGADIIQLRAKKESHAERTELLEAILPLFEERPLPLIINDDIDLALLYPGLGLHVGQDDLPVSGHRLLFHRAHRHHRRMGRVDDGGKALNIEHA